MTPKQQLIAMLLQAIPEESNTFAAVVTYDTRQHAPVVMQHLPKNASVTIGQKTGTLNERRVRIEVQP